MPIVYERSLSNCTLPAIRSPRGIKLCATDINPSSAAQGLLALLIEALGEQRATTFEN